MTDIFVDIIFQDYEIQEQIGKGGFATVFRAKNYKKNQDVAVKVVSAQ